MSDKPSDAPKTRPRAAAQKAREAMKANAEELATQGEEPKGERYKVEKGIVPEEDMEVRAEDVEPEGQEEREG
jgi:hypothetical protein